MPVGVSVDGDAGVDASAVNGGSLFVEASNRRAHALGAHRHHRELSPEITALVAEVGRQEPMGEAERGRGLHRVGHAVVQVHLGGVGDQEQQEV